MGSNIASKPTSNRHFNILQTRFESQSKKNKMYGQVVVVQRSVFQAWKKKLQKIQKYDHFHMLIPSKWSIVESSFCGNGQVIELQYDVFDQPLTDDIETRLLNHDYYPQCQIWYLIWTITQVADQCNRLNQKIGDINQSSIYVNSEGHLKMITPFTLPANFESYYDPFVKDVYFSPQELNGRKIGQVQNLSQSVKSTSFSIGMTLLSIILLKPLYFLYNYDKNQLDSAQLQQEILKLSEIIYLDQGKNRNFKYSITLQNLIRSFLKIKPEERSTFDTVYGQLIPHCNSIAQLKPFEFGTQILSQNNQSPVRIDKNTNNVIKLRSKKLSAKKQEIKIPETSLFPSLASSPQKQRSKDVSFTNQTINFVPQKEIHPINIQQKALSMSGVQLLRRIDQKLLKSRSQFPN